MRFALGIEYDGRGFLGWQSQRQSPTVQDCVEQALSRVADHPVRVVCAGRTDTGVHAECQVAHFDSDAPRSERSWVLGANQHLPEAASVLWVRKVDAEFHARFSAYERRYRFRILNRWARPALEAGRICWCRKPLDAGRMHDAAQALRGEHDFSAFRAAGCSARHAVREVTDIHVSRQDDVVEMQIAANGFLYRMVRNIAGSLIEVGAGERPVDWMEELLSGRDRTRAGVAAGPEGLYFMAARYPDRFELPSNDDAFPHEAGA
ncbi:MAG: tRNA pseudouridine(38-40) synthase TruA [Xanthomonadales bacterium]|nr:tRNA pseudouridine(38-40) synthase TruA [Xanthomonadales bacterium]NIN60726.1 tRNA pseudouridine(38-40) synthase TruA [Xanthomonadales bacterium]NIN76088.1 tRNA pseudouridine(38-40) synthase TruA [Xanthomonadales bacterium]NIO15309.1 tRNA pseudouridine(38-40) synthase TruA [Xanthomonadales bacterium]NIP13119.1 tRNA pseudouridine(38-40) synthase TruA [Xanthomonadales bacterium]